MEAFVAMLTETVKEEPMVLDPQIRDWVVLPMVGIMVLMGLVRHHVQQLLDSSQPADAGDLKNKQTLMRANKLGTNGGFIPPEAFHMRQAYFTNPDRGVLHEKVPKASNNMMNPMGMVDMMKKNVTFMLPNMVMMQIINMFFQGFVLVKVPFNTMPNRFKSMLQKGVDLKTLDVSYVSSLSWYFLVMFGLRGLYKLIIGEDSPALDEAKAAQAQMGMGMMGGPGGFNAEGAFKMERDKLDMVKHKWLLADAERNLLGPRYPTKAMNDEFGAMPEIKTEKDSEKGATKKSIEKELKEEKKLAAKQMKKGMKVKKAR